MSGGDAAVHPLRRARGGVRAPAGLLVRALPGLGASRWKSSLSSARSRSRSNSFLEPVIYGKTTGVSALGLLVAAMFWTWLWGTLGLLLSTPLTVCLAVLGKYVPSLWFFATLLGEEPSWNRTCGSTSGSWRWITTRAVEVVETALEAATAGSRSSIKSWCRSWRGPSATWRRGELDETGREFVWRVVGEILDETGR